ncbi:MAG: lipoyl synthase [Thermoplasmata archaeon]|nr:MAG: lipoyl synthase [Thermoplasmata archaeon]
MEKKSRRHPDWLKISIPGGQEFQKIKKQLRNSHLHTICEEAKCPNLSECFQKGTATFLILGDICTRNCRYCNVKNGIPGTLNPDEVSEVAESVQKLGLSHVVITSVTRDDLKDGGASIFVDAINAIKEKKSTCSIEVLIPDFKGNQQSLQMVLSAKPDVLNHNIEVVKELFQSVRPEGNYKQSIDVLKQSKRYNSEMITKSGFMVGLGESKDQIYQLLQDLRQADVNILTIGQYLQPTKKHVPIKKYYTPQEFNELSILAKNMGFSHIESGPLVRSSYNAENALKQVRNI